VVSNANCGCQVRARSISGDTYDDLEGVAGWDSEILDSAAFGRIALQKADGRGRHRVLADDMNARRIAHQSDVIESHGFIAAVR
jgi:hypothetical protein